MTKERVCANGPAMSRRTLFTALPASGAALAFPQTAHAGTSDPLVPLYHEWLAARREWLELAKLPDNGNWDDPRSLAAEDREYAAERKMLELTPVSLEGAAALAAVAWVYVSPGCTDPDEFAERAQSRECRALMAIWRAGTGRNEYPQTGVVIS